MLVNNVLVLFTRLGFFSLLQLHFQFSVRVFSLNYVVSFFFSMQSFSAVVGPNGSGKSNVIDAMLFVFGKRAKQVNSSPLC